MWGGGGERSASQSITNYLCKNVRIFPSELRSKICMAVWPVSVVFFS